MLMEMVRSEELKVERVPERICRGDGPVADAEAMNEAQVVGLLEVVEHRFPIHVDLGGQDHAGRSARKWSARSTWRRSARDTH